MTLNCFGRNILYTYNSFTDNYMNIPFCLFIRLFGLAKRNDILHDIVRWQRCKWRRGTGNAKTRAEVVGSGKKQWKQKGTGRSRIKDRKAPHMKRGGVAHGPRKQDWSFKLNKKGEKCAHVFF